MRELAHRYWPHLVLLLAATASVTFLALTVETFNPDLYCCDHLYYRGQAEFWTGLGPANLDDIHRENRFWGVVENRETYYEFANGLALQPPYVFRPLVPLAAGAVGHLIGLNAAFYLVTFVSLGLAGFFCGLATLSLAGNLWLATSVAVGASLLPEVGNYNLFNYMLVDTASFAVVAAVLYLVVSRKWLAAAIIAGLVAPLTKETLVTLAMTVALAAFLCGVRSRWLWVVPILPVIVQGLLRLAVSVPMPPPLSALFIPGDQIRPAATLIITFVAVSFLFYGLASQKIRLLLVSFFPVFLLLIVITSSSFADSPRIWLTVWPAVLVLGAVGLHAFLGKSPTRFLWIPLPVLAFAWLHFGVDFQNSNQVVYFALDYGLILIPPVLVGVEYIWRQYSSAGSSRRVSASPDETTMDGADRPSSVQVVER